MSSTEWIEKSLLVSLTSKGERTTKELTGLQLRLDSGSSPEGIFE